MTIKSLTILDMDLIDSNEAILVLNNLPNVQILNGKSTKEEEEEEFEEEYNGEIKTGNYLEEIAEDKNMENNSNYISSDNNIISNDLSARSAEFPNNNINWNINNNEREVNNKEKTNDIKKNQKIDIKSNNLLYEKIMSDDSNKKIISNSDTNINEEKKEIQKENKAYYFPKFMIDITNEELNLLNEEKNIFPVFLQEFNKLFQNSEENSLINIYNNKIQEIENKRGNIPNYYYFYLILKKKISILKNLFDEIFPFILNNCPELNQNDIFIKLYTEILNIITSSKQLLLSLHKHIESFNNKCNIENISENNYNNELNKIIIENKEMISKMKSEKSNLLKKFNEDKSRYENKINKLEKENQLITNKLLYNMNSSLRTPYSTVNSGKKKINFCSYIARENGKKNKTVRNSNLKRLQKHKSSNISNNGYFRKINSTCKLQSLSLKALKEFINELYISKNNYNIKCEQLKLPKETLEEYMYTYLYKKYGLKNIVIDWAKNIINGIKKYSKVDSNVLLFAKILKNEQEEDAQFIIPKISNNVEELLKFYLKKQNPLKSIDEINKIFEFKKKSELNEEEWKGIIYTIYEKKEAEEIQKKIENFIFKENNLKKSEIFQNYKNANMAIYDKYNSDIHNNTNNNSDKNDTKIYMNTISSFNGLSNISINNIISPKTTISQRNNLNNKMTRTEKYNMFLIPENKNIMYNDFLRIVLNSHIRFRDRQLKNYVQLFQSVDTDRDGILNEEEFNELVQKMGIFSEEGIEGKILYFLEKIDPFDNQKITFSESVSFFAGEAFLENDDNKFGNEISILEKICFNNSN